MYIIGSNDNSIFLGSMYFSCTFEDHLKRDACFYDSVMLFLWRDSLDVLVLITYWYVSCIDHIYMLVYHRYFSVNYVTTAFYDCHHCIL